MHVGSITNAGDKASSLQTRMKLWKKIIINQRKSASDKVGSRQSSVNSRQSTVI